jgi:hypothetical protein
LAAQRCAGLATNGAAEALVACRAHPKRELEMSIASDLLGLSCWFDAVANGVAEFTPEGMEEFSRVLAKCAAEAAAIEDGSVPLVPDSDGAFSEVMANRAAGPRRPALAVVVDNTQGVA